MNLSVSERENKERTRRLTQFILERDVIRARREAGQPKPWTKDSILRNNRFCNVRREDDAVTRWVAQEWRDPHVSDPTLWFAMSVARFVNWPPTLVRVNYPVPWRSTRFVRALSDASRETGIAFGAAYVIAPVERGVPKAEGLARSLFDPMWATRRALTAAYQAEDVTLAGFAAELSRFKGMGSFMVAQIIADLKGAAGSPLSNAPDRWTWASSGPGSRRGLNRALGRAVDAPWVESAWARALTTLKATCGSILVASGLPQLCAQDFQNCLCEFDKYERVRLGEGRMRRSYDGG